MLVAALQQKYPGIRVGYDASFDCVVTATSDGLPYISHWSYAAPQPTYDEAMVGFIPLLANKAQRIVAINTECRARLLARFGDPAEQVSRSIGVY